MKTVRKGAHILKIVIKLGIGQSKIEELKTPEISNYP
jgi:hypothetical protein